MECAEETVAGVVSIARSVAGGVTGQVISLLFPLPHPFPGAICDFTAPKDVRGVGITRLPVNQ